MDDRNGETFDRHDELFGTSDSEHECLREFLLDTVDASRNVPCGKLSSGGGNHPANNYTDTNVYPLGSLENNNAFENHIDAIARTAGTEFPINCEELTFHQPSISNLNLTEPGRHDSKLVNGEVLGAKTVEDLNVDLSELLGSDLGESSVKAEENHVGLDLADDLLRDALDMKVSNDLLKAVERSDLKIGNDSAASSVAALKSVSETAKDSKVRRDGASSDVVKMEQDELSPINPSPEPSSVQTKVQSNDEAALSRITDCSDVDDISALIPPTLAASGSGTKSTADLENGQTSAKPKGKRRGRKKKPPGAAPVKVPVKRPGAGRGRPPGPSKKKPGAPTKVPKARAQPPVTYQSQISPDQHGIKLFIKKSCTMPVARLQKVVKKRRKKAKKDDEEESDGEGGVKRVCFEERGPPVQTCWGELLPVPVLEKIFLMGTADEGCFPYLLRVGLVCRLWHSAASRPSLWHTVDFSNCKKVKNLPMINWMLDNRLSRVQDLNLTGCKVSDIRMVVRRITSTCKLLRGINLAAWSGLTGDDVRDLAADCPLLARFDLSSISPESLQSKSAVSLQSISSIAETTGARLTHLLLANNKVNGLPQIITAIATHCPNLQVLDISNVKTMARTTALLHIERLQAGCPLLRVLRITNSEVALSPTPLMEQAASPGFPMLEELSCATVTTNACGLSSTPIIDDNSIERILKTSHKLRLLDVRGCTRITDSSLVRVPAWDLEHLFLSGCQVTRMYGSGLELIAQKWCHSLVELDLAWSSATQSLDAAVAALAECDSKSRLSVLNLCGSSVSLDPVKKVLRRCPQLSSLNLASCRALPRGIKRLYEGTEVDELRTSLEKPPAKPTPTVDEAERADGELNVPATSDADGR